MAAKKRKVTRKRSSGGERSASDERGGRDDELTELRREFIVIYNENCRLRRHLRLLHEYAEQAVQDDAS